MRNFKRIVGLLFFVSFSTISQSLPSWFITPPNDSNTDFYSVGSGDSLEQAKQNALVNLSARLIVNIESEQESQVEKLEDDVQMRLIANTIASTEQLTFFKSEVLREQQIDQQMFVLMSSSKSEVLDSIADKLNQTIVPLLQVEGKAEQVTLSQALQFYAIWPTYSKYYRVLQAYDYSVDTFRQMLTQFENRVNFQKRNTSYSIIDSAATRLPLKAVLNQQMQSLGFSQAGGKDQLQVTIVGPEIRYGENNGNVAYQANGKIVYVLNGEQIYSNDINVFEFGVDKAKVWQQVTEKVSFQALIESSFKNAD